MFWLVGLSPVLSDLVFTIERAAELEVFASLDDGLHADLSDGVG